MTLTDSNMKLGTGPASNGGGSKVTIRAVVIGLLVGVAVAAFGYKNSAVLNMAPLAVGHLPVVLCGLLIVAILTINPLLGLISRRLAFQPSEWAIVLAVSMLAVPVLGQMGTLIPALVVPSSKFATTGDANRNSAFDAFPREVLVNGGQNDEKIVNGFINGTQSESKPGIHELPKQILNLPWEAWAKPLGFWLTILGCCFIAMFCLSIILHRQWSTREHLRFPIAEFISTLISGRSETTFQVGTAARTPAKSLFSMWSFWIPFGVVFGIHLLNGLAAYNPSGAITIDLNLNTWPAIAQKFPKLGQSLAWLTFDGKVFLAVIALAFFLNRDVSLAVGLTPFLHDIFLVVMLGYGLNPRGPAEVSWNEGFFNMGALLGIAAAVLWLGRSYYIPLVIKAVDFLGLWKRFRNPLDGVWTARLMILCTGVVLYLLWHNVHFPMPFSLILIGMLFIVQIVASRINVETGLFYYCTVFWGHEFLVAWLGIQGTGPAMLAISSFIALKVITADSTQPMMAFAVNALEVLRRQRVPVRKVSPFIGSTVVITIIVATIAIMLSCYSDGGAHQQVTYNITSAQQSFDAAGGAIDRLATGGTLKASKEMSTWDRMYYLVSPLLRDSHSVRLFWPLVGLGFGLVLMFMFLRRRFTWWPVHPIVFAMVGTTALCTVGFSFLIGWGIRTAVVKIAGESAVQKVKPVMLALIAAELVAAVFWLAIGWIYYLRTDAFPPHYAIFPGY